MGIDVGVGVGVGVGVDAGVEVGVGVGSVEPFVKVTCLAMWLLQEVLLALGQVA